MRFELVPPGWGKPACSERARAWQFIKSKSSVSDDALAHRFGGGAPVLQRDLADLIVPQGASGRGSYGACASPISIVSERE